VLPVVEEAARAAASVEEVEVADSACRDSDVALAVGVVVDFAQRPDADVAPAVAAETDEGEAPVRVAARTAAAGDVGGADEGAGPVEAPEVEAPDVEAADAGVLGAAAADAGSADAEAAPDVGVLPGLAGRGGGLAAGGGEARGAGRAGGTVGIADFGTGLGDVAEVGSAPKGRLVSAGVAEAGFAAETGLAGRALAAPELATPGLADRPGAAAVDADPDGGAMVDTRAAAGAEPVGVTPVFGGIAGARRAAPAGAVCD
jgi:hypothetical protein